MAKTTTAMTMMATAHTVAFGRNGSKQSGNDNEGASGRRLLQFSAHGSWAALPKSKSDMAKSMYTLIHL